MADSGNATSMDVDMEFVRYEIEKREEEKRMLEEEKRMLEEEKRILEEEQRTYRMKYEAETDPEMKKSFKEFADDITRRLDNAQTRLDDTAKEIKWYIARLWTLRYENKALSGVKRKLPDDASSPSPTKKSMSTTPSLTEDYRTQWKNASATYDENLVIVSADFEQPNKNSWPSETDPEKELQIALRTVIKVLRPDLQVNVEDTHKKVSIRSINGKPDFTVFCKHAPLDDDILLGLIELKPGIDNADVTVSEVHGGQIVKYLFAILNGQRWRLAADALLVYPKSARLIRARRPHDGVYQVHFGPKNLEVCKAVTAYLRRSVTQFGYVEHGRGWTVIGAGATSTVYAVESENYVVKITREDVVVHEREMHQAAFKAAPSCVLPLKFEANDTENPPAWFKKEHMLVLGENVRRIESVSEVLEQAWTDLACGLDCIHKAGILHRDLRRSNLGMRNTGNLVFLDFGFSLQMNGEEVRDRFYVLSLESEKVLQQVKDERIEVSLTAADERETFAKLLISIMVPVVEDTLHIIRKYHSQDAKVWAGRIQGFWGQIASWRNIKEDVQKATTAKEVASIVLGELKRR